MMQVMTDAIQYEVLDDQGHKTGQLLDINTIHVNQLWHEVVNVWIINTRGEILMQLRGPGVDLSPNVWDVTIGTHLHPEETPTTAALRCLHDGLGLVFAVDDLKHLFNTQAANPLPEGINHNVFGHVFMIHRDIDITSLTFDQQKITNFAWKPLMLLMADLGNEEGKKSYFPRANNYYPQLFEAFQAWM